MKTTIEKISENQCENISGGDVVETNVKIYYCSQCGYEYKAKDYIHIGDKWWFVCSNCCSRTSIETSPDSIK